jgi:two-component system OmpR family sensor kinase
MRFSLRTRILAATLILVALGLAVAGIATYGLLRKSLLDRVDDQLLAARFPVTRDLADQYRGPGPGPGAEPGGSDSVPTGTYAAVYLPSGAEVAHQSYTYGDESAATPAIPIDDVKRVANGPFPSSEFQSVGAIPSGPPFRLGLFGATSVPNTAEANAALVIGIPLAEMNQTLHRLVLVELGVAAAVVVAIGLLSWWLVRLGLRPLDRMAETAGAIAGGDLSKRVEPADHRTEVGQLGTALNTMLGRIETSFEEQRASEARLRRFVADASHELRTPLTSIRGYAELFRRGAAGRPEDLERAMRRIEDEGVRMGLLVDDLLLLARLDQGRPLELRPVDLTAVVRDAADDLRAADPEREVTLEADTEVSLEGDEPRLRQVVANLLDNARIHTPVGTPVTIRLAVEGEEAILDVTDHGPGMSDEEAARVFERFYRGDPSRSRESGGTGLGLSIAAAIVRAHGGTIGVSAAPGDGATFRIRLPLQPAPTLEPEATAEAESAAPDTQPEGARP